MTVARKSPDVERSRGAKSTQNRDPEALELGRTIRRLRTEAGLTLSELSETAGVSKSLISAIELGRAAPSISTLRGVCHSLGVPLAQLFLGGDPDGSQDRDATGRRVVVRKPERRRLRRSGSYYELLTPDVNRKVEFLWAEFEGGVGAPPESGAYVAHPGEENVLCLSGSVVFNIDGREFKLAEGDSISFDCSVPHRLDNPSRSKTALVIAISPPSF